MNKNKRFLGIIISMLLTIAISVLVSGCTINSGSSVDTVINVNSLVEAEVQMIKAKERVPISEVKALALDYRDGVYFGDYDEVKDKLNKQTEEKVTELLSEIIEVPYIVKAELILYNSGFKEAKENNYDLDEIVAEKQGLIKTANIQIYSFVDGVDENPKKANYHNIEIGQPAAKAVYDHFGVRDTDRLRAFDKSLLDAITFDEMEQIETGDELFKHLRSINKSGNYAVSGRYGDREEISDDDTTDAGELLDFLKEKYNEEFELIDFERDITRGRLRKVAIVAPERDNSLRFMSHFIRFNTDRYKSVLLQKFISDYINKIIEDEGAGDYIGQFTSVGTNNDTSLDVKAMLDDPDEYLRTIPYSFDVGLYYLKTPSEKVDYQMIINVLLKIQDLVEVDLRASRFVYVYEVEEVDRSTILELFKSADTSEYYFRDGMNALAYGQYGIRNNSDCFKFLEVYGKPSYFMYRIEGEMSESTDGENFRRIYKQENIWK